MPALADSDITVSVVIAAYNVRTCILRAIDSARNSQGVSLEIIVIDDGSVDGTPEFVESLASVDARIRLVRLLENSGPAAARNRGFTIARGRWAAVLDADDAYCPGRLARLVALGDADKADIVADNFATINLDEPALRRPALRTTPAAEWLDIPAFLRGARPGNVEADFGLLKPLFRLSFFRKHGLCYPEDVRHGEDFELVLRSLAAGARYRLSREDVYYLYTSRQSGLSRTRVNYATLSRRTDAIAYDQVFRDNPALVQLLNERADALTLLELHRLSYGTGRRPISPPVLWQALRTRVGRQWLAERVLHHVRK